jgi:hypothetical protein
LDKNSFSGHVGLFPYLEKNTGFNISKGFGGDFEDPNIWLFDHLDR